MIILGGIGNGRGRSRRKLELIGEKENSMKKRLFFNMVFIFSIVLLFQSFYTDEGMWPISETYLLRDDETHRI